VKQSHKLGFWEVFCIAIGAMISYGLFILPGQAFKYAGPAVVISYILATVMVLPAVLSKAELATAMPKSGGSYFFIERSMGALPGTLAGLAGWFSIALKSAFAMVGIGAFVHILLPGHNLDSVWVIKGVAIGCCVIFTILNMLSVKVTGRLQVIFVVALLAAVGVFIVVGLPKIHQHPNFDNLMQKGVGNTLATGALVLVAFGGITKIARVAGEIRNPGRNIPGAMFLSCVVVSLLYFASLLIIVGVVDAKELAGGSHGNLTPMSLAAGKFMGRGGVILLSVAGILALATTGNSGIFAASRSPLAMSRDGLLPSVFQKVSTQHGTPYVSIIFTGAFMVGAIALLSIGHLIKVASTMMLTLLLMVNLAVLIMRGSGIQNYRPLYLAPLYPWLQIFGIILYAVLIGIMVATLGAVPLFTIAGFLVAGVVWYFIYVYAHRDRESALFYMIRNVMAKEIYRSELEEELREIAIQRDEVVHDRFDELVKKCEILDLAGIASDNELFTHASEILAKRLDVDAGELFDKLKEREAQSSTLIGPNLAVPHVILEGENLFDILPVRCSEGILFERAEEPVRVIFILVGSQDERNFHLRALMNIAQIVQETGFYERWIDAPGIENLRDILLLSERQRHQQ